MIRTSQVYIMTTLIYFHFGNGSMFWAWFNMVSLLLVLLIFMDRSLKRGAVSFQAKRWVDMAGTVTIARIIYTSACVVSNHDWIYAGNRIFTYLILAWITIKIMRGGLRVL